MTSSTRAAQGLRRAGAIVMDGVRVALDVREELANAIRRAGVTPGLATIIVGRDAPSLRYVRNKATAAIAIGCDSFTRMLPESTTERQLLDVIAEFNADPQVHGIIVQLPLPDHIDPGAVLQSIDIGKDVDGFHPLNMGRLAQLKTWTWDSRSALQIVEDEYPAHAPLNAPCAPQACLTLLDKYDVPIEGRIACVVGRSNIVGLPTTLMLMKRGATVVNVSKMTERAAAADLCRSADIVVAAVGVPEMIDASWVKPGAAVLDVGMNYVGAGRRCVGDVAFDDVSRVAGYLSPVPGGIGPVCVAELLRNTLRNALATKSREGDRRPRLRPAAG
ncbi:hypothetical protein PBRA_007280 [Plasmodiophora brassicae]|nr:hypothetical protein PBRA_007280 [Plasmodiophora brassicae]